MLNSRTDRSDFQTSLLFQLDFVEFDCPLGYYFNGTTSTSVYSVCHNWTFVQLFSSEAFCTRKSNLTTTVDDLTHASSAAVICPCPP
jgi:hypothetical protein